MVDNVVREEEEDEEEGEDVESVNGGAIREQDRLLPIANVGRLMRKILPPNAKISKDAKETIQESASEFVAFVTGEASDKCRRERRKTVNGDDVCSAFSSLGFDNYALALRRYLHRYRHLEGDRASAAAALENSTGAAETGIVQEPRWRSQHQYQHRQQEAPVAGQMMSFSGVVERGSASSSDYSYKQPF